MAVGVVPDRLAPVSVGPVPPRRRLRGQWASFKACRFRRSRFRCC